MKSLLSSCEHALVERRTLPPSWWLVRLCATLSFALTSAITAESAWVSLARTYCLDCHDGQVSKGKLNLEAVLAQAPTQHSDLWEGVVRRLQTRQMPPAGKKRPDEATYRAVLEQLESTLDSAALAHPRAGRTATLRRMNRVEYHHAIRDLLGLDIDAAALLPADEASHGFDNVTVDTLSPTLLERYLTAAQKISRVALGVPERVPGGDTLRLPPDRSQEAWVEGLPLGTRGGAVFRYTFPRDGGYDLRIRLSRDRDEKVEGLKRPHTLVVLLDDRQVQTFTVTPAGGEDHGHVDDHLTLRLVTTAGPHRLGVTFLQQGNPLEETLREPYQAHFNAHRHPRLSPAIFQVSLTGPYDSTAAGESPSRQRILSVRPNSVEEETACARQIVATLMRRAYRRPVAPNEIDRVLRFYHDARAQGDFVRGIEAALSAILVSRDFLFRIERDPPGLTGDTACAVDAVQLASRLSFFLWSSIPDEELLTLAERGDLLREDVLIQQTRRLLTDPRSAALVDNFASQWLHLRNLAAVSPDARLFPDFDDNLRQAMRRETELLFNEVIREDHNVIDLLVSSHTWLNERLAKHYGIPHIQGAHFRRVELPPDSQRGGLLRHASTLTVTSYATRTSPVIRGKWILDNLLGTPPPPPAPDVPALDNNEVSAALPVRVRLAAHRANPACASCHDVMDPVGFALEHYDALGRWRILEADLPVDDRGGFPDGSTFAGVGGLEHALAARPAMFVNALAEKLLTYALGRGIERYDAPAVRGVVRHAAANDFRFSSIIIGIVTSVPFRMRQTL
jgi:Protein of unknown function (DUF1592)/Protein of unknown function (DUF1588)/Protein of unknown function (DUF1585)/Protein of unknown function (DUF1595)/Protein of unknown function (DUF1587)